MGKTGRTAKEHGDGRDRGCLRAIRLTRSTFSSPVSFDPFARATPEGVAFINGRPKFTRERVTFNFELTFASATGQEWWRSNNPATAAKL